MAVANRAIKARGKASPDRIQKNISNAKVIKAGALHDTDFVHIAETEELTLSGLPSGNISLPLDFWVANKAALSERNAVQLAADQTVQDIAQFLDQIDMIVLPIVNFVDGRSYSHAHLLRTRYQYQGEIRAIGDVHFDQLDFLQRCGCNAFEVTEEEDQRAALDAFNEFSEVYQPATDGKALIFSRRRTRH